MKNASLILNLVLLVAVGVLFYLHFSAKENKGPVVKGAARTDSTGKEFRIAYFELDSITNNLSLVKDVRNELAQAETSKNNELARLNKLYNDRVAQYQNSGQISQAQSEDLMMLQEKLGGQAREIEQRFNNLNVSKMQDVKSKIEAFLKDYNKNRNYSFIFSHEPGFMFYRDTTYNITADLIKGLNDQYTKKK